MRQSIIVKKLAQSVVFHIGSRTMYKRFIFLITKKQHGQKYEVENQMTGTYC